MAALESRAMPVLYGFWLSSCTWRVRAALRFKGIDFEERAVDIVKARTQHTDSYRAINPAQKVPALVIGIKYESFPSVQYTIRTPDAVKNYMDTISYDGETIVESMAILQYLEETRSEPSLTPKTPILRARMREICETIVSGIQPLQNVGLRSQFETEALYIDFTKHWTKRGLQTLEDLLGRTAGKCCVGDDLTQADLCLVPQLFNAATRHRLDVSEFPTTAKLYEALLKEKVFVDTHPKAIKQKQ